MSLNEFKNASARSLYSYRRNPIHLQAFMILKRQDDNSYTPVGDYTVLDRDEDPALSEKKVINLVSALNGQKELIQLGEGTKSRLLFKPIPRGKDTEKSKVIFYKLTEEQGVSKENAILTIEEDLEQ